MFKSLVVLAALSTMSSPVFAQATAPAQSDPTAKPQTVKKRVCYQEEEDSYSRLGGRKVCKMVEVKAPPASGSTQGQQTPEAAAPNPQGH